MLHGIHEKEKVRYQQGRRYGVQLSNKELLSSVFHLKNGGSEILAVKSNSPAGERILTMPQKEHAYILKP